MMTKEQVERAINDATTTTNRCRCGHTVDNHFRCFESVYGLPYHWHCTVKELCPCEWYRPQPEPRNSENKRTVPIDVDELIETTLLGDKKENNMISRNKVTLSRVLSSTLLSTDKTIEKPWGAEFIISDTGSYEGVNVKYIFIEEYGVLSTQFHLHKTEIMVLVEGKASVNGKKMKKFKPYTFKPYEVHTISHRGEKEYPAVVLEIAYNVESPDDIVRLLDKYQRV